jgi:hypothetical protein
MGLDGPRIFADWLGRAADLPDFGRMAIGLGLLT